MEIIGYHGTCSKHKQSIITTGLTPDKCKYRNDHWLGQGVYFFDDYDKAFWWASSISSRNYNSSAIVFSSIIKAPEEEVLDLDDSKQLDKFMTEILGTINDIKSNCPREMPVFTEESARSVFFDYYKQKNKISVIIGTFRKKCAGYTIRRNADDKILQNKIMNIIGIEFMEKQICVSKKECIKFTTLIYDENEEVM